MLNQTSEAMTQQIDYNHLTLAQVHPDPWAQFGICIGLLILLGFYFFLGVMSGRPGKLERQLIGRALRNSPPPEDQILLDKYNKLLDEYREKPR